MLTKAAGATATEQFLEEVAEAPARAATGENFVVVETALPLLAESAWRRMHFVARPVAARTQLVVGLALGRISQGLVSLVDRLELLFRAGLLADVGMVFTRQPTIGGLDFRIASARFHAQRLVVILELHRELSSAKSYGPQDV